jgi:hypothetical protein
VLASDAILQHHGTPAVRPSLEALSKLLYLIRRSLDDPAKTKTYLDIDIVAKQSFRWVGPPGADNL